MPASSTGSSPFHCSASRELHCNHGRRSGLSGKREGGQLVPMVKFQKVVCDRCSSKSYIAYIQKFAFHSSHNEKQINALYNQSTLLFESLPETRCSVNAIHTNACTEHLIPHEMFSECNPHECMYRASHPPPRGTKCIKIGSGGWVAKFVARPQALGPHATM